MKEQAKREICIYCRGVYGIRAYLKLRDLGIPVGCFGDADKSKQGYVLDGVSCVSYEEICAKEKDSTVIFVCKENPETLMEQFQAEGFSSIYSYETVQELAQNVPETKLDAQTMDTIHLFRERFWQLSRDPRQNVEWECTEDGLCAGLGQVLLDFKNRKEELYGTAEHC